MCCPHYPGPRLCDAWPQRGGEQHARNRGGGSTQLWCAVLLHAGNYLPLRDGRSQQQRVLTMGMPSSLSALDCSCAGIWLHEVFALHDLNTYVRHTCTVIASACSSRAFPSTDMQQFQQATLLPRCSIHLCACAGAREGWRRRSKGWEGTARDRVAAADGAGSSRRPTRWTRRGGTAAGGAVASVRCLVAASLVRQPA